jgi:hypothetical protein
VIDNADENILDKEYRQLLQQAIAQQPPKQKKLTSLVGSRFAGKRSKLNFRFR